ncbi:MAG: hypothetical protein XU15_C0008G0054 [candidate division NC10 bacterium CSP1-5]|nr:MAG: hypothetical protein XU15_C0008G0054 [candidate division NC10 bacterium CSP1-5]
MWPQKDSSVDHKVIFWTAITILILIIPLFTLGATLTIFSLMVGLIPYYLVVRLFGDFTYELLVPISLLSYSGALALVLGTYWVLTRGIRVVTLHGLRVELSSETLDKIKIVCAVAVNLLFFLFLYVFFPASPEHYP